MEVKVATLREVKAFYRDNGDHIMGEFIALLPRRIHGITAAMNFSRDGVTANISEDIAADIACDISPDLNPRLRGLSKDLQDKGAELHRRIYSWE